MAKSGSTEVNISIDNLEKVVSDIAEIDTKIGAATGSDAAVRKSLAEGFAADNAEQIDGYVTQFVDNLKQAPTPFVIGLRNRLETVLSEEFDEVTKEFLDAAVKKASAGSDEDVSKLREARKAMLENYKSLRTILETFGVDVSSVPEPKRSAGRSSSGGGAARTGRNKEGYRFILDGKDRPNSQNTISSLAFYATVGCPLAQGVEGAKESDKWSTKQLKDFLAQNGVNYGPDDEWSVTLPNKSVIGARRLTADEIAEMEGKSSDNEGDDDSHESETDED